MSSATTSKDMPNLAGVALIDANRIVGSGGTVVLSAVVKIIGPGARIYPETLSTKGRLNGQGICVSMTGLVIHSYRANIKKDSPRIPMPDKEPEVRKKLPAPLR